MWRKEYKFETFVGGIFCLIVKEGSIYAIELGKLHAFSSLRFSWSLYLKHINFTLKPVTNYLLISFNFLTKNLFDVWYVMKKRNEWAQSSIPQKWQSWRAKRSPKPVTKSSTVIKTLALCIDVHDLSYTYHI